MKMNVPQVIATLKSLVLGLIGAELCVTLNVPVPWMVGPLLLVGGMALAGQRVFLPVPLRQGGQWVVGMVIGLYFTPVMLGQLWVLAPWLVLNVVFSLWLGLMGAWMLQRLSGVASSTAFYAMAVGAAAEMVVLAERHAPQLDRVVASHTLRVMVVVLVLPFAFGYGGIHGEELFTPALREIHYPGMLLLFGVSLAGVVLFRRIGTANAWMLGTLAATVVLTGSGIETSALPQWLVNGGQLLLACSLASRITPEFLSAAPRYSACVLVTVAAMLSLTLLFAYLLHLASDVDYATLVLATAPGGLGELSITAKVLQLGVPVVTAFQVTRMIFVLLVTGMLHQHCIRWLEKRAGVDLVAVKSETP